MIIKKAVKISQEAPTKLLSSEFCEVFQKTFFIEHLLANASEDRKANDFKI